jgi:uncharacterized OsmC-like protein
MTEKIIVRQKADFSTEILVADPDNPDSHELMTVHSIFELTPYSMLLASIGTCTTILLHSYAQKRGIDLQEVEIRLEYKRNFKEDCENCENIEAYTDQIDKEMTFTGTLKDVEKERLLAVSHQCPVHRIVEDGIPIKAGLAVK